MTRYIYKGYIIRHSKEGYGFRTKVDHKYIWCTNLKEAKEMVDQDIIDLEIEDFCCKHCPDYALGAGYFGTEDYEKYHVVKCGDILFTGSEKECSDIISRDLTGELEMYPEEGRIKED